ncbi:MAG: type II secretion system protein J [Chthoniobacteraceae bacterium]
MTLPSQVQTSRSPAAFTMLELMVAGTVLLILIMIVTEMVSNTMLLTNQGRDQVEADNAARMVFDRMALDFDKMINRRDVDYIFKNRTADEPMIGNDALFFYSEAPAYTSSTSGFGTVALVGYRVVTSASNTINGVQVPVLERLGKRLSVEGAAGASSAGTMVFGSPSSGTAGSFTEYWPGIGSKSNVYTDGTDACYHVLSSQVVRMETAFLLKSVTKADGTVISGSLSKYSYHTEPELGHTDISGTNYRGLDDVAAVVVSLAILDNSSRRMIGSNNIYTSLINALDDYNPDSGLTMAEAWKAKIESGTFAKDTGLSKAVASQVRVYQRFFYLK